MKIISVIWVILLIYSANKLVIGLNNKVGTNYGSSGFEQCFNSKEEIARYKKIIIGTSITRELSPEGLQLVLDGKEYFNCGQSAIENNLNFSYILVNILGEKFNIHSYDLIIELSPIAMFDDKSIVANDQFNVIKDILPYESKVYLMIDYLLSISKVDQISEHRVNLARLLVSLSVPSEAIRNIELKDKMRNRENSYKNIHAGDRIDPKQASIFQGNMNYESLKRRMTDVKTLARKYGADVKFYIPPLNINYINMMNKESLDIMKEISKRDDVITVLANINDSKYFADCCHLNDSGRVAVYEELK